MVNVKLRSEFFYYRSGSDWLCGKSATTIF